MLNVGASFVRSTDTFGFTRSELRRLRALKTPAGIQKFLDDLPYNLSYTARSPKKVLDDRTASCLEGGIFAAAALRRYSRAVNLARFDHLHWMTTEKPIWFIAEDLCEIPHISLLTSAMAKNLTRVDRRTLRGEMVGHRKK